MEKSTFTPQYEIFKKKLVAMRKAAGLTQRELAKRLGREHSFIARIEQGERRVDVVEFYWICKACGFSSKKAMIELLGKMKTADRIR